MKIRIYKITQSDASFLHKLMNTVQVMESLNEVSTDLDSWHTAINDWNKDADEENYIIYCDDIPAGWLGINSLESADKKAYIKMLALLPEYQNKGIGKYSVNYIKEYLKSIGYSCICLYTDEENLQAQICYSKCGFTIREKVKQRMSNGKYIDRYKMECVI